MNSHYADNPFKQLKEELELTLQRAQLALKSYLEGSAEVATLNSMANSLDQVRGVLVMLDWPEAARLMDEMGHLIRGLVKGEVKQPASARELLPRLLLQMPIYLQDLQPGAQRRSLKALSLINELRAARGVEPLIASEGNNIEPTFATHHELTTKDLLGPTSKWRSQLQRALLGVLRRQNLSENLERIATIFSHLKQTARDESTYQFWWLAEGLILELLSGGVELGREVNLVLRDLDHRVKRLMENREDALTETTEQELIQRIVGLLSTSESGLVRLESRLDYHPPQTGLTPAVEQSGLPDLIPPATETLQQIAAFLQESLVMVKDSLDRFSRNEERPAAQLHADLESLQPMANVLNLLNVAVPAVLIQLQLEALSQRGSPTDSLTDDQLVQLASELILVEGSLDGLVRFVYSQELAIPDIGDFAMKTDPQAGIGLLKGFMIQQARAILAKNIIEDMSLARESAVAHIHNSDSSAAWNDLQPILHRVQGALAILDCQQAEGLIRRLEGMVQAITAGKLMMGNVAFMNAFAETIVVLEYYLKGLEDGKTPDEDILDHADQQLVLIEGLVIETPELENPVVSLAEDLEADAVSDLAGEVSQSPAVEIDPEFLEIFIQEAREELTGMGEHLARWRNNLTDESAASSLHRSFHTLKGSGRMVGERVIAEAAWCFEELLGQVVDGNLSASPRLLDLLDEVRTLLEQLLNKDPVDDKETEALAALAARAKTFRNEVPVDAPEPLTENLIRQAEANLDMAATDSIPLDSPVADPTESASWGRDQLPPGSEPASAGIASATDLDQELVQVFLQEATEILDTSELLLQRWATESENTELLNALRRELHTLKGSSRTAGLMAMGDLAHAMESLLDAFSADETMISAGVVEGLQRALDRLHDQLTQIRTGREALAAQDLIDEFRGLLQSSMKSAFPLESIPIGTTGHTKLDQDLVEAFLEEATEILDASELLLQRWAAESENTELLNALRRELHTLKGSSRMAGLMAMGDLVHAMESLLDTVIAGKTVVSDQVVEGLQCALDRLQEMVGLARKDEKISAADDIANQLNGLGQPGIKPVKPTPVAQQDTASTTTAKTVGVDSVRVGARLLDNLVNQMGESSIHRARIEQKVDTFGFNLTELNQIASRLRQQLRRLEIETESQILFRYEKSSKDSHEGFDPLELDRFSELQQLSRSLMETVDDLSNIQEGLEDQIREIGFLVDQQAKVNKEIRQGLMRTRMVRFDSIIPRLRRIVRQACQELGKQANLLIEGSESEVERAVLENIIPPLEHLLRNAVAHGIEMPARRRAAGKAETGTITLALSREGSELVLRVSDDGAGLDFQAIRAKGQAAGLLRPEQPVNEQDLIALLLQPGFSTATHLTQVSGRGVGLDVLNDAVKAMRGILQIRSQPGQGASFIIRLPFSLAVTKALLVRVGDHTFAIPALGVEAVTRLKDDQWQAYWAGEATEHQYGERHYSVHSMGILLGDDLPGGMADPRPPALLFHSAEASAALQVDAVLGSQEIIVKPVAPHLSSVPGISGATVLGDGGVVIVLELTALVRNLNSQERQQAQAQLRHNARREASQALSSVLIVDDSITMRKVTARLLERHNMNTATAKDGVDAVALLEEQIPDLIILDIEMPRMDGYEFIAHIRSLPHLRHLPIIVITSRSGQKHRERAIKLGINGYLSKPYQEDQLLEAVHNVLNERQDSEIEMCG